MVTIGGREVVAFLEVSRGRRILYIYPIPADGSHGLAFTHEQGTVDIWGADSARGQRIANAYRMGYLPGAGMDWVNEYLGYGADVEAQYA